MNREEALDELRVLTLHSVLRSMSITGATDGSFLGGLNVRKSSDALHADYSKGVNAAYGYTVGDRCVRITVEVI